MPAIFNVDIPVYTIYFPTDPFTIFELQNPSHKVPELHEIRRSPDFEALKL